MKKWYIRNTGIDYLKISDKFKISPALAKMLVNRNINEDDEIDMFLNPTLDKLHDSKRMKDVYKAAVVLNKKIAEGCKIRIIGDYDVDGVISTYILYKALKRCGANVDYDIPDRIKDGYGINVDIINRAKIDGVDTIITCDNGIAALAEIEHGKELGMTIIVTDHHDVGFTEDENGNKIFNVPDADFVINPKQADCPYEFKKLCGAAVAFKFVEVLYDISGIDRKESLEFIEFVAIATVCDVVDLIDENRAFVKYGLKLLNNTKNIGLKALIKENGIDDKEINAYHLGFVIGPCINASGRLDNAKRGVRLLLADNIKEAEKLAKELYELNCERKDMTQRGVEMADEIIKENKYYNDKVLVVYVPQIHESLAGIVAGRIREKYNVPTIIITKAEKGAKGSGRSIEEYNMFAGLLKCGDLLNRFGGHPMAAGLSIDEDKIDILRKRLNEDSYLTEDDLMPKLYLDMQLPIPSIDYKFIENINKLQPFGKGNPKPIFGERGFKILRGDKLGKNRNVLKLKLICKEGLIIYGIYFGDIEQFENVICEKYGEAELEKIYCGISNGAKMDIAFYPEINEYGGDKSIQLVIEDFR